MIKFTIKELEELAKAVDPKDIRAFLQHSKIMNDDKQKMDARVKAAEAVYALNLQHARTNPKEKKLPELAQNFKEPDIVPGQPAVAPPVAPTPIPFHEEFAQHHNVDPVGFKQAFDSMNPQQQQVTRDFHANHLAGLKKSLERVYGIMLELKKQL